MWAIGCLGGFLENVLDVRDFFELVNSWKVVGGCVRVCVFMGLCCVGEGGKLPYT